jgi:hypothetical protein
MARTPSDRFTWARCFRLIADVADSFPGLARPPARRDSPATREPREASAAASAQARGARTPGPDAATYDGLELLLTDWRRTGR